MRLLFHAVLLAGFVTLVVATPASAADEFQLEPGFALIFNGKDLTGWETKQGGALDGKTEAFNHRFEVRDGILVLDPKVKGDVIIQTTKKFPGDVHLKFEFQPGPGCNNDLFFRGIKFDIKKGDVKNLKEGMWNEFEVIVAGDKAEFKSNGEVQRSAAAKKDGSPLGIRAEFGEIQFRRLRVKETPPATGQSRTGGGAFWQRLAKYFEPPAEFAGKFGPFRSPLKFADGSLAKTPEDWKRRRQEILAAWHRRLGAWPPLVERPEVKRLETVDRGGYVQHHVHVQISPEGKLADGYLLMPKGPGPFPAVFVPFYEPLTSIGQEPNGKGKGTHDYGLQLVRRGFVTLSIGTPGSIEKVGLDTRKLLVEAGVEQHRQPLTILAYMAANCHTALAQLPEVDPARIGIIGLSYGGKWTMFASCLHDKFACAVWSDPGIVFNEKNVNVNYWEPWYLGYDPKVQRKKAGVPSDENPRTGLYKEMVDAGEDLVDFHALIAPRPVLVSGGTEDPPQNWQALNHLVAVNDLLGQKHRVAMTARPTHIPTPEALELELAFLEYWLKYGGKP